MLYCSCSKVNSQSALQPPSSGSELNGTSVTIAVSTIVSVQRDFCFRNNRNTRFYINNTACKQKVRNRPQAVIGPADNRTIHFSCLLLTIRSHQLKTVPSFAIVQFLYYAHLRRLRASWLRITLERDYIAGKGYVQNNRSINNCRCIDNRSILLDSLHEGVPTTWVVAGQFLSIPHRPWQSIVKLTSLVSNGHLKHDWKKRAWVS